MPNAAKLQELVERFKANLSYYQADHRAYNEDSCRIEYIDPLLTILDWDVANTKGTPPQYREVIVESYSSLTERPDYSLTLRGVAKIFVEVKKPSVDISCSLAPALQTRKYGWNAKHKVAVLTNFEYLIIYDTTIVPKEGDACSVARYRIYHYLDYVKKFEEIYSLMSRNSVYSGDFDKYWDNIMPAVGSQKQQVDELFISQMNSWRVALSNELYTKNKQYHSLEVLNDVVQRFINQIVFLRICEDKNLPTYHSLLDSTKDPSQISAKLEKLFRDADKRYNANMFSGKSIVFDLSSQVITGIIKGLYYPESPYMFNIIEPNMLGKIYEMFLTEQLIVLNNGTIGLAKKRTCVNRSVITTPTEIVKYMVEKTLSRLCVGKTPQDILALHIADIACGSGIFLEEVFEYLQIHCVGWYLKNKKSHLIEIGNGMYKLPLDEKKKILCSCIYGIDIDIHAVEVAKFSLLIKLIENETKPSVADINPILPDLAHNIVHGNSLVSDDELGCFDVPNNQLGDLVPFNWDNQFGKSFDAIIGNPPYVNTEGMHSLLPPVEFKVYKKNYFSSYKQFDKYFIFLERAIEKVKDNGYVCYIIPNKFFKVGAGENLRQLIASSKFMVSLDDFGDAQLFEDRTIYSSIILLQKKEQSEFAYAGIDSADKLWIGEEVNRVSFPSKTLNKLPWKLTTDFEFLNLLKKLDEVAVPLENHAEIFNGIQTSAERPTPVYWFSSADVRSEKPKSFQIEKDGQLYNIEKNILKPYFKPTRQAERGLNSYSILTTDKYIIFPYDSKGHLFSIDKMKLNFPGTYQYLKANYKRLVPKCVSAMGTRDVPNATQDTWYQYGRIQALTAFINTPKLIVGVLSKEPMYAFDRNDMLIASGGTAGYCAIKQKKDSPYALEYIQAWLSNSYTEEILKIVGSDFEGGFIARGTFVLNTLPFVELDFNVPAQKEIYDAVVEKAREIYVLNEQLTNNLPQNKKSVFQTKKDKLISEIQRLIAKVYRLDFHRGQDNAT